MINIVYITDSQYVLPTGISISSLVKNVDSHKKYSIYILGVGLSDEAKCNIQNKQSDNVTIHIMDMQNEYFGVTAEHLYVSKAALLKFRLAEIFLEFDKILYIDGDTLIQSDLEDLYNHNVVPYYVAAVSDMNAIIEEKRNESLPHDNYFNSGVMLINLCRWREENICQKLLISKKNEQDHHFMDQSVLNKILGNHVLYLEMKYNCMYTNIKEYSIEQIAEYYKISLSEAEEAVTHPVVLHLTNYVKPWRMPLADKYEEWVKYADIDVLKACIPNYYQTIMQEIMLLEEKMDNLDKQLQYVRRHTAWSVCCRICDKIRGGKSF